VSQYGLLCRLPLSCLLISEFDSQMELANLVLTFAFAMEMLLKLFALRFSGYFKDYFNIFDCLVVAVSIIELGLAPPALLTGGTVNTRSSISILRTMRLLRVFKLAR
jgi:hypothetical protein